jgi:hypothetical protein
MSALRGFAAWFGFDRHVDAVVGMVRFDYAAEVARVNALYAVDRDAWRAARAALWRRAGR